MTQHVFVYGSLKSGKWNNPVLGGSKKVTDVVTVEDFLLTDCGFPYLIPEEALGDSVRGLAAPVRGELWSVTEDEVMESLDALEGVGWGHYQHKSISVYTGDGKVLEALAYVPCEPEAASQHELCPLVEGVYEWN